MRNRKGAIGIWEGENISCWRGEDLEELYREKKSDLNLSGGIGMWIY